MHAEKASLGGLPIAEGDVLLKKYRVERLIGEGGTGIVVSATHLQLEQRVAIKFLRRAFDSSELRMRFEREARAMGAIESEHVVVVLDAGALADGAPFMVMEYLEGRDLARVLKEDGPLPVEVAVDCMLQVCEALRRAHAAGIVHRDLKPANLFLTRRSDDGGPHVKVVDFGISKILAKARCDLDGASQDVTSSFTVLGSPRYMAPEQVTSSKDVDHRADLWSVGAVLFQLITGDYAFEAEGSVAASLAVLSAQPRSLRALAPHAPPGLEDVVMRCLTKDVNERFQTATELANALRSFASEPAKASLDRILVLEDSAARLAVSISPASTARGADDAARRQERSTFDRYAPTERKMRIGDEPRAATALPPALAPAASRTVPKRVSARMFAALGLGACAIVVGAVVAFGHFTKRGAETSSLGAARFNAAASSAADQPSRASTAAERDAGLEVRKATP